MLQMLLRREVRYVVAVVSRWFGGTKLGAGGLIRAYGSVYEKAGHWPGSFAAGDPATGLLVDEAQWGFDCTRFDSTFDQYSASDNANNPLAGQIYMLIYADAQAHSDVYFAGRIFRVEPGTTT